MATMDGKSLVQEPKCNPHPKAPHGFDRNASHSADRYVCECEGWDAYDAGYQAGIEDTYKRMDALDKKAENARELGLDYEPVAPVQEDWGPGPHEYHSLTASVQEPDYKALWQQMCERCDQLDRELAATDRQVEILSDALSQLSKQKQEPVAWRYRGILHEFDPSDWAEGLVTPLYTNPPNVATPLDETSSLAAPIVPDVMTTAEGEHPEYVQGWNDCRQLMLQTRNNQHD